MLFQSQLTGAVQSKPSRNHVFMHSHIIVCFVQPRPKTGLVHTAPCSKLAPYQITMSHESSKTSSRSSSLQAQRQRRPGRHSHVTTSAAQSPKQAWQAPLQEIDPKDGEEKHDKKEAMLQEPKKG